MLDPGFVPTTQELRTLRDICAAADGLPALIEVAAAATRLLSLDAIRDALHSSSSLLDLLPEAERLLTSADEVWRSSDDSERSEEHTSELQSLMRISYAVFCLKKKQYNIHSTHKITNY